jgi:hypothetical protein
MDAKLARAELVFRQSAEPFQHSYTYVDMFELHLNMFEHVTSNMRTTLLGLLCHVKDRRYFTKPTDDWSHWNTLQTGWFPGCTIPAEEYVAECEAEVRA